MTCSRPHSTAEADSQDFLLKWTKGGASVFAADFWPGPRRCIGRQDPRGNSAAFSTQQPDREYLKEEAREFGVGGILALTLGPQSLGGCMGQNFRETSPLLMSSLPSPHTVTGILEHRGPFVFSLQLQIGTGDQDQRAFSLCLSHS